MSGKIRDVFAVQAVDASKKVAHGVASMCVELSAADVAELNSSTRFVERRRGLAHRQRL